MRAQAIREYKTILQALNEPGCPLCAFLKNSQSKLLQEGKVEKLEDLCNAHTWALAAVRRTSKAARVFLSMIETHWKQQSRECSVFLYLAQEETFRVQELIQALEQPRVFAWLGTKGVLCLPHGMTMREHASGRSRQLIETVLERRRSELEATLRAFVMNEDDSEIEQAGALGRAAEFLVAQRGVSLRGNIALSRLDSKNGRIGWIDARRARSCKRLIGGSCRPELT